MNCTCLCPLLVFLSLLQKSSSQAVFITAKQMTCKCIIPALTFHSYPKLMLWGVSPWTFQNLKVKIHSHFLFMVLLSSPQVPNLRGVYYFSISWEEFKSIYPSVVPRIGPFHPIFIALSLTTTCMNVCISLLIVLSCEIPRSIFIKPFLGQHLRG